MKAIDQVYEKIEDLGYRNLAVYTTKGSRTTINALSVNGYLVLVMEFEKEFNIDIPDEDAEKLRTVGDALDYLKSKVKE